MLMFMILLFIIGLALFICFAKRTDARSDSMDHSPRSYSDSTSCSSSKNDDTGFSDDCHRTDDSSSDSGSCE